MHTKIIDTFLMLKRRFFLLLRLFFGSFIQLGFCQWFRLWFTHNPLVQLKHCVMHLNASSHIRKLADFGMAWEVFYKDAYPYQAIKSNPVIVDIGAHIGSFSVKSAISHPAGTVFAYEPTPDTFSLLSKNTSPFSNIKIFKLGVSDKKKSSVIYVNNINPAQNSAFKKTNNSMQIDLISLHDVFTSNSIDHIDLLKIDCEGSEYDIMFSSVDLLDKIENIYLEVHDPVYFGVTTQHTLADLVELLNRYFNEVKLTKIDNVTSYIHAVRHKIR